MSFVLFCFSTPQPAQWWVEIVACIDLRQKPHHPIPQKLQPVALLLVAFEFTLFKKIGSDDFLNVI